MHSKKRCVARISRLLAGELGRAYAGATSSLAGGCAGTRVGVWAWVLLSSKLLGWGSVAGPGLATLNNTRLANWFLC